MSILKSKLFWFIVVAAFLALFWLLGGVNAGLGATKKYLASKEIEVAEQLKTKLETAENNEKVAKEKARVLDIKVGNLEKKDLEKIKEILAIKEENKIIKKELEDAEKKLAAINVPNNTSDRVIQFHSLGLKSAIIVPKPKSEP